MQRWVFGMGLLLCASVSWGLEAPLWPTSLQLRPFYPASNGGELDLWWQEVRRQARTPIMLSPQLDGYVYSEALYLPNTRQTVTGTYWVPLPESLLNMGDAALWDEQLAAKIRHWPAEQRASVAHVVVPPCSQPKGKRPLDERLYTSWLEPTQNLARRELILNTADAKEQAFGFDTLTPVDFSANGQALLLHRRVGLQYLGLRCSDVLLWLRGRGEVVTYPEITAALNYQWQQRLQQLGETASPPQGLWQMAWDVEPLGFEGNSDHRFIYRAWAYTWSEKGGKQGDASFASVPKRYSLGLWRFDTETLSPELLSDAEWSSPSSVQHHAWTVSLPSSRPTPAEPLKEQPPPYVKGFHP